MFLSIFLLELPFTFLVIHLCFNNNIIMANLPVSLSFSKNTLIYTLILMNQVVKFFILAVASLVFPNFKIDKVKSICNYKLVKYNCNLNQARSFCTLNKKAETSNPWISIIRQRKTRTFSNLWTNLKCEKCYENQTPDNMLETLQWTWNYYRLN